MIRLPLRLLLVAALPAVTACADDPSPPDDAASAAWRDGEGWTAVEELRIGAEDGGGPYVFGDVAGVEIDPLGRVWVLDAQARELRVFGADGRHVRTVGREGGGPGELRDPTGIAWDGDGRLWVADPRGDRYVVFDTAGAHVATHRRPIRSWMMSWGGTFDRAGRLLERDVGRDEETGEPVWTLVRLAAGDSVAPVDTVRLPRREMEIYEVELTNGSATFAVPFSATMHTAFDGDEAIWFGASDEYRLLHRSFAGDTLHVAERSVEPEPVTRDEREDAEARITASLNDGGRAGNLAGPPPDFSRIPDVHPRFEKLLIDDRGHLWVARRPAEGEARPWDVFDPEGRFLGTVRAAADLHPVPVVRGDRMAAVVRDELDVPRVVVHRLAGRDTDGGTPSD